jgi:Grap2 and cyclin-D-interacting
MSLENQRVLDALERLAATLKELPDSRSPDPLSHWRSDRPEGVETAFAMLEQGQSLVQATSTKYTLVTKIDMEEGSKLAKDLLRGCECLATGALVIHDDAMGCSRSLRKLVKHAVRAVVHTCISLLQLVVVPTTTAAAASTATSPSGQDGSNAPSPGVQPPPPRNLESAAQKTGAIWDACEKIGTLPNNNRNAMRRDLLTWMMECQDTMDEFAELLLVPTTNTTATTTSNPDDMTTWEMFTSGQSDEYSVHEQPIAVASLALIKCSRGSLKVALQACETVGSHIVSTSSTDTHERPSSDSLAWISKLHDAARDVGNGMTDLGSLLYPPLELDDLEEQVAVQCKAIVKLQTMILENPPSLSSSSEGPDGTVVFDPELVQLSTTIRTAAVARAEEAQAGITALL